MTLEVRKAGIEWPKIKWGKQVKTRPCSLVGLGKEFAFNSMQIPTPVGF